MLFQLGKKGDDLAFHGRLAMFDIGRALIDVFGGDAGLLVLFHSGCSYPVLEFLSEFLSVHCCSYLRTSPSEALGRIVSGEYGLSGTDANHARTRGCERS